MISRPRCTLITATSPPDKGPTLVCAPPINPSVAVQVHIRVQAFYTRKTQARCEMSHGRGIKSDILFQPPSRDKSPERSYRNPSKPRFLLQHRQLYLTYHADAITDF